MDLKKYKSEMSRAYPDRKFVEDTLSAVKNRQHKPKKHDFRVLKTVGGIGLSAAVLCGAFLGAGAVRSLFDGIEPDLTDSTEQAVDILVDEDPELNDNDRIEANETTLSATPLASNPAYTVKVNTPDGKVALNEDTTIEEMLAVGALVVTDDGPLGMQYFCEAARKQKNGEAFEFILAHTGYGNIYTYYDVNEEGDIEKYWTYNHQKYFYIEKQGQVEVRFNYFASSLQGTNELPCVGLYGNTGVGFATTSNILDVTCFDKEERKQMYFDAAISDEFYPILGLVYNDESPAAFRLNYFAEKIEKGVQYASVQFTDITTTSDYDEIYYSIEYVNGKYSIFTMTDGLDGKFDTQYFDGFEIVPEYDANYKLRKLSMVFDNGEVSYSFKMSTDTEADIMVYVGDKTHLYTSDWFAGNNGGYSEKPEYSAFENEFDCEWVLAATKHPNTEGLLVINQEYSTDTVIACEVDDYRFNTDTKNVYLRGTDEPIGTNAQGDIFRIDDILITSNSEEHLVKEMPDGKQYVFLSRYYLQNTFYASVEKVEESENGDIFEIDLHTWHNSDSELIKYPE